MTTKKTVDAAIDVYLMTAYDPKLSGFEIVKSAARQNGTRPGDVEAHLKETTANWKHWL